MTALQVRPSRDNDGRDCSAVGGQGDCLPDHIQPCACETHDDVCEDCGFKVTVGSSGTEYGHARARNKNESPDRSDCPHRPEVCDPGGPRTDQRQRGASS